MKQCKSWYLPTWDTHFEQMLNGSSDDTYQQPQRTLALKHTPDRNRVIDIGANVGFWSRQFIHEFNAVEAFEPMRENRICWWKNVDSDWHNWNLYPFALSDRPGKQRFYWDPNCCGNAGLSSEGVIQGPKEADRPTKLLDTEVEVRTLDSFEFNLVSLIKIDCQGLELEILKGGYNTIKAELPTLCLELPRRTAMEVQEYNMVKQWLEQFNYNNVATHGKDTIWVSTQS